MRYADKVTIVTGGTKGIGEGCVRAFVGAGARVVFCARGQRQGDALAAELNERGPGEAVFVRCDVSKVGSSCTRGVSPGAGASPLSIATSS